MDLRAAPPRATSVRQEIQRLVVPTVTDNPQWGYTRIQGALKNVGHRVARSTIASIFKRGAAIIIFTPTMGMLLQVPEQRIRGARPRRGDGYITR